MDEREFLGIGEQICSTIQNAIDSMDFQQLNRNINDTISQALSEAKKQIYSQKEVFFENKWMENSTETRRAVYNREKTEGNGENSGQMVKDGRVMAVRITPVEGAAGILLTVFGGIGVVVSLTLALVMLSMILFFNASSEIVLTVMIFLLFLLSGCMAMLLAGVIMRRRRRRLRTYMSGLGGRRYCPIQELADRIGRDRQYVASDLRRMIQLGMIQDAYLDAKDTYVILGAETYRQYKQAEQAYHDRIQEEQRVSEQKELHPESKDETAEAVECYLEELREVNRAIPEGIICAKLQRLELVVNRIFETAKKRPEGLGGLEKFMDYYVPTTLKLVNAYRDFDSEEIQGENIRNAKQEIEQTLDTINGAFERLLDEPISRCRVGCDIGCGSASDRPGTGRLDGQRFQTVGG